MAEEQQHGRAQLPQNYRISSSHIRTVRQFRGADDRWANEMRGRWFPEEIAYLEVVYELFLDGLLDDVQPGCTFREFMAELLECDTMRISKKFSGVNHRIGHLRFPRAPQKLLPLAELNKRKQQLETLETNYLNRRAVIRPRKRPRNEDGDAGGVMSRHAEPYPPFEQQQQQQQQPQHGHIRHEEGLGEGQSLRGKRGAQGGQGSTQGGGGEHNGADGVAGYAAARGGAAGPCGPSGPLFRPPGADAAESFGAQSKEPAAWSNSPDDEKAADEVEYLRWEIHNKWFTVPGPAYGSLLTQLAVDTHMNRLHVEQGVEMLRTVFEAKAVAAAGGKAPSGKDSAVAAAKGSVFLNKKK